MVNKKPRITKQNEAIPALNRTNELPSISSHQLGTGTLTGSTPQTGSPTTANSGLVSAKKTNPRSKTPRQIAEQTTASTVAKSVTSKPIVKNRTVKPNKVTTKINKEDQLRISAKRRLAFSLLRGIQKSETILDRALKYFTNNNYLKDPVAQNLNYGSQVESKTDSTFIRISFDCKNKSENIYTELKKQMKDCEIAPYDSQEANQVSMYIKTKNNNSKQKQSK